MDRDVSERIYSWIGGKLVGSEDPCSVGRKLTGDLSGLMRYRVGDYQIIAEMRDSELVVLVKEVEHRKKVHDRL